LSWGENLVSAQARTVQSKLYVMFIILYTGGKVFTTNVIFSLVLNYY